MNSKKKSNSITELLLNTENEMGIEKWLKDNYWGNENPHVNIPVYQKFIPLHLICIEVTKVLKEEVEGLSSNAVKDS